MKDEITCQVCESSAANVEQYSDIVEFKGIDVHVEGLQRTVCLECGYTFATSAQHDSNVDTVRAAFVQQRAQAKRVMGRLTGEQIRAIRTDLGLSQQEAADLFGGGVNAFSRYENEEVVQPASVDGFLRLAAHLGTGAIATIRASKSVSAVRRAEHNLAVLGVSNPGGIVGYSVTLQHAELPSGSFPRVYRAAHGQGQATQAETMYVANPLTGAMARVSTNAEA